MRPDALGLESLPQKDFVVISPYLVDPDTAKRVNAGDGFILDSALKLVGARPAKVLSSRMPISAQDLELINGSKLVLVAGANTLKSSFEITPGFTPAFLDAIKVPVALFGIGHYGVPSATAQPLDAPSETIMREILRRFPYISVRCDASAGYLSSSIPDLAGQVLMTSCPVVHPVDGVDRGFERKDIYDRFVLTVTDRQAMQEQAPLLSLGASLFNAKRRILALHQDYGNKPLWDLAKSQGYEVFVSPDYGDFLELYKGADIHLGNRVHGHLKCLSYGARSFLTPFDLRQVFFSQSLDFPLLSKLPDPALDDYDFGRATARVKSAKPAMESFVKSVRAVLDS